MVRSTMTAVPVSTKDIRCCAAARPGRAMRPPQRTLYFSSAGETKVKCADAFGLRDETNSRRLAAPGIPLWSRPREPAAADHVCRRRTSARLPVSCALRRHGDGGSGCHGTVTCDQSAC